jgi:hypothetical protein
LIKEIDLTLRNGNRTKITDMRYFYGWLTLDEMAKIDSHVYSYVKKYDSRGF